MATGSSVSKYSRGSHLVTGKTLRSWKLEQSLSCSVDYATDYALLLDRAPANTACSSIGTLLEPIDNVINIPREETPLSQASNFVKSRTSGDGVQKLY